MKICPATNIGFNQFFPWRISPMTKINSQKAEELMDMRDSINVDPWMENYDVDAFVYTAPKTHRHPHMKSVKLFIRPAHNYFARIRKKRPEAKIGEYERSSTPFWLYDEDLEDKIREFLRKQQRYIRHCVHSDNHGVTFYHKRDELFSTANTKQLSLD